MKLVISSSELLKGLLTVAKAIPAKTTEAILEDYLFVLSGDKLEVTASDKEITMKTCISIDPVRPEDEGRIAVPARQLNDLLKELPDQPITISTISETSLSAHGQAVHPHCHTSILTIILRPSLQERTRQLSNSLHRVSRTVSERQSMLLPTRITVR